ncbi:MAG: hypothetical protein ACREAF_02710 [Nitrosopumilaceae archaeon]
MMVTAWNNGQYNKTGGWYGFKISIEDRDKYFKKYWKNVILNLDGEAKDIEVNIDKPSFWSDECRELISKDIGIWLINNNKGAWAERNPPKLKMEPTQDNRFTVKL